MPCSPQAARLVLARCPWTSAQTAEGYTAQLRSEADEAVLAVANRDHQNFKEELGDLVWDVVMCALLAERSGHFPAHEVFDDVVAKMRRRKPFVFNGTEVTDGGGATDMDRGQGQGETGPVNVARAPHSRGVERNPGVR